MGKETKFYSFILFYEMSKNNIYKKKRQSFIMSQCLEAAAEGRREGGKQLRTEGPAPTTRRTSLSPNEIQLIDNKRHQINFSRMLDFDEGKNLSDFNRGGV